MKCKYCQAELEDGAAICPVCGKEQDAAEEESVRAEQAPAPAQTPDNAETPASPLIIPNTIITTPSMVPTKDAISICSPALLCKFVHVKD